MTFLSDLARLREAATKGKLSAGRKTEYGTIWPDSIMTASEDKHEANRIAAVYGLPLNCKREELIEDRYVESLANIDLIVLLLNHSEAIEGLVRAVSEEHGGNHHEPECPICVALAKFNDAGEK